MNHNTSNVGKPTLFHQTKSVEKNIEKIQILTQSIEDSYWKKYWGKINIDTINWEELFKRSADHKTC